MSEFQIKKKLIEYLLKKDIHQIIVPEVTVGHKSGQNSSVRADIFTINGEISIYEIKSEKDSLVRLSKQIENYKIYANKVNVVIAEKFLSQLNLDDTIGIYIIKDNGNIKKVKSAVSTPIETNNILEYWLSNELKDFLRGYKGTSKLDKSNLKTYLKKLLTNSQINNTTLLMLKNRYSQESHEIKRMMDLNTLIKFPKRGLQVNNNIIPLKEIPFGLIMP